MALIGCGLDQKTTTPTAIQPRQVQAERTDQAAQGISNIVNNNYYFNGDKSTPVRIPPGASSQPSSNAAGVGYAQANGAKVGPDGLASDEAAATWLNNGGNVYISIGSAATGAQGTGGNTGQSSTASAAANVKPSAEQKPETAIPITLALAAPGGAANANGAGSTGSSSTALTPTQQAEGRYAMLKGLGFTDQVASFLSSLFGQGQPAAPPSGSSSPPGSTAPPASAPASAPAPTVPSTP